MKTKINYFLCYWLHYSRNLSNIRYFKNLSILNSSIFFKLCKYRCLQLLPRLSHLPVPGVSCSTCTNYLNLSIIWTYQQQVLYSVAQQLYNYSNTWSILFYLYKLSSSVYYMDNRYSRKTFLSEA